MESIEIARKLAMLDQKADAQEAYTLALNQEGITPEEELEAASYIFFSEGDHRIAFTALVSLFNRGLFQGEIWDLVTQAFYLPNVKDLQKRYDQNVKALSRYPYLFRKDFPAFEDLPFLFFPFDEQGFVPFYPAEHRFGDYVNFSDPVIDQWFFKDLSKPVLGEEVYSQYQLEYLNDNVRKSEWVAKENHIYLHYTDWVKFCTHLQVLDFRKLLNDQKFVFLFGEEIQLYPIDFKERFGIDYSTFEVRPLGVREFKRLIWHTQLSADNGGDFFNEIFYDHPNLLLMESIFMSTIEETVAKAKKILASRRFGNTHGTPWQKISHLDNPTDKDVFLLLYFSLREQVRSVDPSERIVPAVFFQPHFPNIYYHMDLQDETRNWTTMWSREFEQIRNSPIFKEFTYIKTFTPMRRPTTSYAASVRSVVTKACVPDEEKSTNKGTVPDQISVQMLNRSYMVDPWSRLYRDSRLVRFEDGKLNPKATFTALAEFLDLPYTESMTYCSGPTGRDPESYKGNAIGFDPRTVYATYDEYANDDERALLEYMLRDAYKTYGYNFHYYKGEEVDADWLGDRLSNCSCLNTFIYESWLDSFRKMHREELQEQGKEETPEEQAESEELCQARAIAVLKKVTADRRDYVQLMSRSLQFISYDGQLLEMMPPLKLDPALLEQPLYH